MTYRRHIACFHLAFGLFGQQWTVTGLVVEQQLGAKLMHMTWSACLKEDDCDRRTILARVLLRSEDSDHHLYLSAFFGRAQR